MVDRGERRLRSVPANGGVGGPFLLGAPASRRRGASNLEYGILIVILVLGAVYTVRSILSTTGSIFSTVSTAVSEASAKAGVGDGANTGGGIKGGENLETTPKEPAPEPSPGDPGASAEKP